MSKIVLPINIYDRLRKNLYPLPSDLLATKNFSWKELLVNQIEIPSLEVLNNLLKVATILQSYRNNIFEESPITITSGWRSPNYNKKIGGALNSYHLPGMAIDFVVNSFSPRQVQLLLNPVHKGGLEFAPTWTHIDIRKENIRFDNKGRIVKYG